MEKEKLKTEITILELLNWLVYDIPPTKNDVIHSELNNFIENNEQNYNASKTNLTFEKFCELKATYDDIINKIREGYLPLYAYKIYDPWALYLTEYKEQNPKELVYQGGREDDFSYNLMCHPINFLLDYVTEKTHEKIESENYDVWKESYIKYKKQNKWNQLPSFGLMKEAAIASNGCYTYDGIVVKLRDAQNTYYTLSTFCNKFYKRTKEPEQKQLLKLKKEKWKKAQIEKNRIRKVTSMKAKIIKIAKDFMKMEEYKYYSRKELASEIHVRLDSEGYKVLKVSTIQSYLPAKITKYKRGRREKNPVKHIR